MSLLDLIRGWFHKSQQEPADGDPPPASAGTTGPSTDSQTAQPSNQRFVLLIHGYSSSGTDFLPWKKAVDREEKVARGWWAMFAKRNVFHSKKKKKKKRKDYY